MLNRIKLNRKPLRVAVVAGVLPLGLAGMVFAAAPAAPDPPKEVTGQLHSPSAPAAQAQPAQAEPAKTVEAQPTAARPAGEARDGREARAGEGRGEGRGPGMRGQFGGQGEEVQVAEVPAAVLATAKRVVPDFQPQAARKMQRPERPGAGEARGGEAQPAAAAITTRPAAASVYALTGQSGDRRGRLVISEDGQLWAANFFAAGAGGRDGADEGRPGRRGRPEGAGEDDREGQPDLPRRGGGIDGGGREAGGGRGGAGGASAAGASGTGDIQK